MYRTLIFGIAVFVATAGYAQAQSIRLKTVIRHANPLASCTAIVASPLAFTFDPITGNGQDATGIVALKCAKAQKLDTITITAGNSNSFLPYRQMWKGGAVAAGVLDYNIYTSSAYGAVWGDGTGGSSVLTVNEMLTSYNAIIYAKVPFPQSSVSAGQYSDNVTVTFNLG